MDVAQDAAAEPGERIDGEIIEEAVMALPSAEEKKNGECQDNDGANSETDVTTPDSAKTSPDGEMNKGPSEPAKGPSEPAKGPSEPAKGPSEPAKGPSEPAKGPSEPTKGPSETTKGPSEPAKGPSEPTKSSLDKELEALLSSCTDPPPLDVLMIQSEHAGMVDIVKVEQNTDDPAATDKKAPPPPLRPPTTWTSANIREFKHRMASEKHGLLTVRRGEVMTVRVPTHPEGKRLCWEFATDDYDIGFGIYFDWTPVTSTAVTIQVSDSSDDEEEEETESPWHSREGDVERGSVYRLRSRYGEIMQVFRKDSHREVQAGSHDYPGEGVYLLKLDNSYSLLRNKALFFHVYYSS
ncbi:protein TMED8 isoform X2 [Rana temporaria]|uniref:protein TMED8 isoform X2 n=1 Tax=Rana temporaria TaxID=8407 RepID=UPI001AAC8F5C|nr:protein TMED8 isoform X2 [Rana temporaria]